MTRKELKKRVDDLMQKYADEKMDGDTYYQKMMELTTSAQNGTDSSTGTYRPRRAYDSGNIKKGTTKKRSKKDEAT